VELRRVELAHGARVAFGPSDLTIPRAATTAVIGPNGSGKSTVLDAVAGLLRPLRGEVLVFGDLPVRQRRRVAYVSQTSTVAERLPITVREVVTMGRYALRGVLGRLQAEDHRRVDAALDRLGLGHLGRRRLDELSGGQRQRVFVAQALVQDADLILLDEPVTGLDVVSRHTILDVMAEEVARGATVVLSTHDIDEARAADQVVLLAGVVVAAGPPAEVLRADLLAEAFGARVLRVGDEHLLLDDHAHGHGHEHPTGSAPRRRRSQ